MREDLSQVHLVEVNAPVFVTHPPGAVVAEDVVELLFEALVVIPSLVLISELASPFALAPGVSDADQLELINLAHVENTVRMVKQYASLSSTVLFVSILIFNNVGAADKVSLRMVFLDILPELLGLDHLSDLGRTQVVLL